ncbi:MAG: hypothetical protein ACJAYU_002844 [Bradymonadia bacterium]
MCPVTELATGTCEIVVVSVTATNCADDDLGEYDIVVTNGMSLELDFDDVLSPFDTGTLLGDGTDDDLDFDLDCADSDCDSSLLCGPVVCAETFEPCSVSDSIADTYLVVVETMSSASMSSPWKKRCLSS